MLNRILIAAVILLLAMVAGSVPVSQAGDGEPGLNETGWYARIITSSGTIVARLFPEQAPQSVAYFAALARGELVWNDPYTGEPRKDPYYDGLKIHKAEAGQRFEVGDPTGSGQGYAPFYLPHEGFGPIDFSGGGRLGNTRSGGGLISGSMFFISAEGMPWLNGRHPCFGAVISGRELVRQISAVKTDVIGRPLEPVMIETVEIFSIGDPDPLPLPVPFKPEQPVFELRKGILPDSKAD